MPTYKQNAFESDEAKERLDEYLRVIFEISEISEDIENDPELLKRYRKLLRERKKRSGEAK